MDEKLPYYMAYPMPLLYDDERQNQRDYEYMKSVYPGTAKRLIPYIEEECDRLEYWGALCMTNIQIGCSCCCFAEEFIIARKKMKQRKMKQKKARKQASGCRI